MVVYSCKESVLETGSAEDVLLVQLGCDWVSSFWLHLSSIIRIITTESNQTFSRGWGDCKKKENKENCHQKQ